MSALDEIRILAKKQAEAHAMMMELGGGVGMLGVSYPEMFEDQMAWSSSTDNEHADIVLTLLAAVDAVLALHKPFEWSFGFGPVKSCKECARLGANETEASYPCPTVQAVTEALGADR